MTSTAAKSILHSDPILKRLRKRLSTERRLMRKGIHVEPDTGKAYYSGYAYKTLYDWDQYFEAIVQLYMGWGSEYICNGVTIFLDHQKRSGKIERSVPGGGFHAPEHVKPFLAQTALMVARFYGETDWILNRKYYPRLKKYLHYWMTAMDSTGNGLAEWMSAPHTGMDNHHERAGHWKDRICKGVDLNCYIYRELLALASLADRYDEPKDAAECRKKAAKLKATIQKRMWDQTDGFYYDIHVKTGRKMRVRAISGFAPMWAGIATPEQAKRLVVDHVFDPNGFWTPYPAPALARSEPGYSQKPFETDVLGAENTCSWRANTWMPTNYMLYRSLKRYGYGQLASLLAEKTLALLAKAGNREWYDAENGEGRGLGPFWGWSILGHFLPFEEATGHDPNAIE